MDTVFGITCSIVTLNPNIVFVLVAVTFNISRKRLVISVLGICRRVTGVTGKLKSSRFYDGLTTMQKVRY